MDVAIVKYNAGNIYSVVNAMKRLGIEPVLTDDAEMLQKADRVLFPGQGQAREAMEYLKAHQLDQVIKNLKAEERHGREKSPPPYPAAALPGYRTPTSFLGQPQQRKHRDNWDLAG